VGWVTNQKVNWEALELSAEFKHQNFNLSNYEGHIIIKAKIKVFNDSNGAYVIKELHINQRYIQDKYVFALIEITPIFKLSKDQETKEELEIFDLAINEPIQNRNWGTNYYRVKIGNKQVNLKTLQTK
jgi:hypothetical protein